MLKTIPISQASNVAIHGRTSSSRQPLALFWSASGLEMRFQGSELWIETETDFSVYEQWISVVLNGAHVARMMLPKGRCWTPLLRGLNPDAVHHIEILRDVQAMPTDPDACLLVHALRADGEFLPVGEKALKLEIIGDSLTSSEGSIGAKQESDWIALLFCAARGYPFLTAQQLNADLRVISQSGWGALSSWDNNPHCALPLYYEQVCGVLTGEKNAALGAADANDFQSWNADVVVINLGTNDASAFAQPAWKDPETGEVFQQRTNPDGSRNAQDEERLRVAMYGFLETVRRCNPHAHILWVHGMLGATLAGLIEGVVKDYCARTGDQRASFFLLPSGPADGMGARNHPGLPIHACVAQALAEHIRSL